jgi:hypothetical protein
MGGEGAGGLNGTAGKQYDALDTSLLCTFEMH